MSKRLTVTLSPQQGTSLVRRAFTQKAGNPLFMGGCPINKKTPCTLETYPTTSQISDNLEIGPQSQQSWNCDIKGIPKVSLGDNIQDLLISYKYTNKILNKDSSQIF